MKRLLYITLIVLPIVILSACQQNTEQANTSTPTAKISVSPSAIATSTPLPTSTLADLTIPTSTPYPMPEVDFSQAIPPTIAPGTLQGKIILNRDYGKLGDDDYGDPDKTTLLYLNDYHEEYFKDITGFSYHWGGGAGFQNASYDISRIQGGEYRRISIAGYNRNPCFSGRHGVGRCLLCQKE